MSFPLNKANIQTKDGRTFRVVKLLKKKHKVWDFVRVGKFNLLQTLNWKNHCKNVHQMHFMELPLIQTNLANTLKYKITRKSWSSFHETCISSSLAAIRLCNLHQSVVTIIKPLKEYQFTSWSTHKSNIVYQTYSIAKELCCP